MKIIIKPVISDWLYVNSRSAVDGFIWCSIVQILITVNAAELVEGNLRKNSHSKPSRNVKLSDALVVLLYH